MRILRRALSMIEAERVQCFIVLVPCYLIKLRLLFLKFTKILVKINAYDVIVILNAVWSGIPEIQSIHLIVSGRLGCFCEKFIISNYTKYADVAFTASSNPFILFLIKHTSGIDYTYWNSSYSNWIVLWASDIYPEHWTSLPLFIGSSSLVHAPLHVWNEYGPSTRAPNIIFTLCQRT